MKNSGAIRKNIAALLLLSFIIASAPKIYFHDLLAKHQDTPACPLQHNGDVVHARGFDCHFDDLVVTAPFFLANASIEIRPNIFLAEKRSGEVPLFYPAFRQHSVTRGPPSV